MSGKPWTEERKLERSKLMRGRKLSAAHRLAISDGQLGNKRGRETGEKIRAKHLARIGSLEERFWKLVGKSDDVEACWIWLGNRDRDGYGLTPGKNPPERRAHRMAYVFTYGSIPDGLLVCHSCDNPPCVKPSHLFLGTQKDNQQDAWAKGRKKKLFGKDNPMFGRAIGANRKRGDNGKFI